ncbi:MAG: hypothetical protein KJO17_13965 [Acidimicrobiia bacterium]|nr:hypothetical protein [Acidimicrobiia bacterium]
MSGCTIYFREDDAIVVSQGISVSGFGLSVKPFLKMSLPVAPRVIGALVVLALESQREGGPDNLEEGEELLRFARARSWKALEVGSRLVGIGERNSVVTVRPHERRERGGGFLAPGDLAGQCPLNADEVGQLVLEKAEECR